MGDKDLRRQYKYLRVNREAGVPQGGVLSGLLANLYLYEFDLWIVNQLSNVSDLRYYRYADDFVILTRKQEEADQFDLLVESKLNDIGLSLNREKTRISDVTTDELQFVGFQIRDRGIRIKPKNIARFLNRYSQALESEIDLQLDPQKTSKFKRLNVIMSYLLNPKVVGFKPDNCDLCGKQIERQRNWMSFFASTTSDNEQIRRLDNKMRSTVYQYFWENYRLRLKRRNLRHAGMKSLVSEYYRQRKKKEYCTCELEAE